MKRSLSILALALISGCATPSTPLKPEVAAHLGPARVYAVVVQEGIKPTVRATNYGALFGLLGGLIDGAVAQNRMNNANHRLEPVRAGMPDFDFRARLLGELRQGLPGVSTLKVAAVEALGKPLSSDERQALWAQIPENGLLVLTTRYDLSADFASVRVGTLATLWQRGQDEPIYNSRLVYYSPPISTSEDPDAVLSAWSGDRDAALRAALAEGISQTMKMLALDLDRNAPMPRPAGAPNLTAWDWRPSGDAEYLSQEGRRYILRDGGATYSVSDEPAYVPGAAAAAPSTSAP